LRHADSDATFVTNVFTGRPARAISNRLAVEIGPVLGALPDFPLPIGALAPLRAKAEQQGSGDFTPFWSGQASPLAREMPAMGAHAQIGAGSSRSIEVTSELVR